MAVIRAAVIRAAGIQAVVIQAETVIAGRAAGPVLRFTAPISFWGGIDTATGRVSDPAHPAAGRAIGGTVLVLAATRGSSSSSAVMLELLRGGNAPAALVLAEVDAILALGVVVAGEMGYGTIPVLRLPLPAHAALASAGRAEIDQDGRIALVEQPDQPG